MFKEGFEGEMTHKLEFEGTGVRQMRDCGEGERTFQAARTADT